jgi:hypothetical protein
MDQSLYFEYTTENQEILADMLETGFYDLSRLHIFETVKTVRPLSFYLHKGFDLIAAAAAGCLIYPTGTGADAAWYEFTDKAPASKGDISATPVELKFAEIDSSRIFASKNGTLYVAKDLARAKRKNTRSSLRSAIAASYTLHSDSNRTSKNVLTMLVVFDRANNRVLDVFCTSGEKILGYLNMSKKKKRGVKLSFFINSGWRLERDISYGYMRWEEEIRKTCPRF